MALVRLFQHKNSAFKITPSEVEHAQSMAELLGTARSFVSGTEV